MPKVHRGGLSTSEGLAHLIHDGYRDGGEDVPPVKDKRLFVVEEEFANVLAQSKRDGNTLSTSLRTVWDGGSIKPATKNCRVWASAPHVALHACITPPELRSKLSQGEQANGFANRFLIFWAERTGVEPFPLRVAEEQVQLFANRFTQVIEFGLAGYPDREETVTLRLSEQARTAYARAYADFSQPHPAGEKISGLLQRRPPMLLRIAGLFAVADLTLEISEAHIAAAKAWMAYYAQSVHMIFAPTVDVAGEAVRNEDAEKLHGWLVERLGWQSRKSIVRECFGGHRLKVEIDEALERLTLEHRVERREVDSGGTVRRTDYRACGLEFSELAKSSHERSQRMSPGAAKGSQSSQGSHPSAH